MTSQMKYSLRFHNNLKRNIWKRTRSLTSPIKLFHLFLLNPSPHSFWKELFAILKWMKVDSLIYSMSTWDLLSDKNLNTSTRKSSFNFVMMIKEKDYWLPYDWTRCSKIVYHWMSSADYQGCCWSTFSVIYVPYQS
jgi:hypothetical protein